MLRYMFLICCTARVVLSQGFDQAPSGPRPQAQPRSAPVAIIKQIDRHNEDGSYTYGYETADGSFKIETKAPSGEVRGKYGYVDDVGKVRVIEYGATKNGFAPSGEGITVPPPTLVDETTDRQGELLPEYSGQYYGQENDAAPSPGRQDTFAPSPLRPQTFAPAPVRQEDNFAAPAPLLRQNAFDFPTSRPKITAQAPVQFPSAAPSRYTNPSPSSSSSQFDSFLVNFPGNRPNSAPQQAPPLAPPPRPAPKLFSASSPISPQNKPAQFSRPTALRPSGGGSILDQLSKDYALPTGGAAPLHDISFGYF